MKILSHRGYWKLPTEKNKEDAFIRSFSLGFGTETDVRDMSGKIVISHDIPKGGEITLQDFLNLAVGKALPMAINIKADGLAELLAKQFRNSQHDWFVFDMSIPDMRMHLNAGNPVFARMSEIERTPPWLDECAGVWLDAFREDWFAADDVRMLLERGLKVCIVSPELHKRDHTTIWDVVFQLRKEINLMLCTDIPVDAERYFGNNGF